MIVSLYFIIILVILGVYMILIELDKIKNDLFELKALIRKDQPK